jgi:hypothetical protein
MSMPAPVLPDPVVTLAPERVRGLSRLLAGIFIASSAACVYGYFAVGAKQLAFSYQVAYVYLSSLLLGSLFWVMIHHLVGAHWSVVIRRFFENNTRFLPIFMLLGALPLLGWLPELFKWADPEATQHGLHGAVKVGEDHLWAAKQPWLSRGFFTLRFIGYCLLWILISRGMARLSEAQDTTGDSRFSEKMGSRSSWGMIILALTSTFFAFDWMMSLDYQWFSTIFGVYYWAGTLNCSMALMVLITLLFHSTGRLKNTITIEHIHDMGKIMFGFTIFWTYISFSQYFLYWYANIPEETFWYQNRRIGGRLEGNWNTYSWALFFGKFLIPFFFLLRRKMKRTKSAMFVAALWIMAFHYLDLYWQIMPNFQNAHDHPSGVTAIHFHWLDAATLVALLSLAALWVVNREWTARPLIPVGDPRLEESLHHKNHW